MHRGRVHKNEEFELWFQWLTVTATNTLFLWSFQFKELNTIELINKKEIISISHQQTEANFSIQIKRCFLLFQLKFLAPSARIARDICTKLTTEWRGRPFKQIFIPPVYMNIISLQPVLMDHDLIPKLNIILNSSIHYETIFTLWPQ